MDNKICKLCFKTICVDSQTIEEALKGYMNQLILKLNPNISKETVTCYECASNLQAFFNFKSKKDCNVKLESADNIIKVQPMGECKDQAKCYFCIKHIEREGLISLHESEESMFMLSKLEEHIPELNLVIPEQVVICTSCLESVRLLHRFVTSCLDVEEKIRRYVDVERTDNKGQIELSDVQQFTSKMLINDEPKMSDCSAGVPEIKTEAIEKIEGIQEEITVKDEMENFSETSELKCSFERVDIEMKIEQDGSKSLGNTPQALSTNSKNIRTCTQCPFETKFKSSLTRHMVIHKRPSEITTYKCMLCLYETKLKHALNSHMLAHKNSSTEAPLYKCTECSFETKFRSKIHIHMVRHKESEVKKFKCDICEFATNHKRHMNYHMITHKYPEEVTTFGCDMCPFKTKYKNSLREHILTHKKPDRRTVLKCAECAFETTRKDVLSKHTLVHKKPSELTMFKCKLCPFETKLKISFSSHMLTHSEPSTSDAAVFKC